MPAGRKIADESKIADEADGIGVADKR